MKIIFLIALFLFGCKSSEKKLQNEKNPRKIAQEINKKYINFINDFSDEILISNRYFSILRSNKCYVGDCNIIDSPILLSLKRLNGKWKLDFISKKAIPNPNDFQDNPFQKMDKINDSVIVLKYNYGTVIENFLDFYFKITSSENRLIKVIINNHDWNRNFDTVIVNKNENITLENFDFLEYIKNQNRGNIK
jgi:hypothetical protein